MEIKQQECDAVAMEITSEGRARITLDDGFAVHVWYSPGVVDEVYLKDLEEVPLYWSDVSFDVDEIVREARGLATLVLTQVSDLEPRLLKMDLIWTGGERPRGGVPPRDDAFYIAEILRADFSLGRYSEPPGNARAAAEFGKRLGALCAEWASSRRNKKAARTGRKVTERRDEARNAKNKQLSRESCERHARITFAANAAVERNPHLRKSKNLYRAIRERLGVDNNDSGYSDRTMQRALKEWRQAR